MFVCGLTGLINILYVRCVVNVNFFMTSTIIPEVSTNYIARAAQCLYNVTRCRFVVTLWFMT